MHFNTGLLLTTVFSAVSLAFFIVGAASVSRGWFKAIRYTEPESKSQYGRWGTTGCCINYTIEDNGFCFEYDNVTFESDIGYMLGGGRVALSFTIFGVVLNCISSVFTGIIGRMTAWRFPHLRSRQDCIASVCALAAFCCGLIATCSFYGLAKRSNIQRYTPRPDYAWVLVLVGSFVDVCLAGATCMHVIVPDTESPWYERPGSRQEMGPEDEEKLIRQQSGDLDDDNTEGTSTFAMVSSAATAAAAAASASSRAIEPI